MSHITALGINHQTAPVELRERVAFAQSATGEALQAMRRLPGVQEVALLSTCNRTEIYAVCEHDNEVLPCWLAAYAQSGGLPHAPAADAAQLSDYLYRHTDVAAVRHLFRVASGLDSLVLGEPQILGQVKQAWATAREAGSLGTRLDRLFQHTFATAKRARTDTRIGANPVSVASAAVRMAQDNFARIADSTVLLIGAGETIELAARHVVQAGVKRLLVANRTLAHAQELAARHGGIAIELEQLPQHLAQADIVFSATASRTPILLRRHVADARAARRHRPMLLLDLAVPRDIAADVAELDDIYLYTVDDLQRAVEDNRRSRQEAAEAAEAIIDVQAARFAEQLSLATRTAPLLQLRAYGRDARDAALTRARTQLAAGQDPNDVLELLAHTLTNRLLHTPTVAVREAAQRGDAEVLRVAEKLFAGAAPAQLGIENRES